MTKTVGIAAIVIGSAWWAPEAGAASPSTRPAKQFTLDLGDNVSMKLVLIPDGKFMMGSPDGEKDRQSDEGPQREVTISKPFYMGIREVTQRQYELVMGKNPSRFQGARNPVEHVSWNEAVDFCEKLSRKTGRTVHLPTEAQWEYACRSGTTTPFHTGRTISTDEANYDGDYVYGNGRKGTFRRTAVAVGSFKPNGFGLYDMHGNVWEWCSDWYADSYEKANNQDPTGPTSGKYRVLRGGYWHEGPICCRSANRFALSADCRGSFYGFRVSVDVE